MHYIDNEGKRFDTLVRTHTIAADQQSFDALYEAMQEIGTIVKRGIKQGDKGHKRALQQIMKVLESVE